jgi:hypothetical protein
MSPLAEAVYAILRLRVKAAEPRITYGALAEQLRESREEFANIYPRSQQLFACLWEVGRECRRLRLPALPALVVRADTKRPGDAYFEGSRQIYRGERIAAWKKELEAVKEAKYPRRRG